MSIDKQISKQPDALSYIKALDELIKKRFGLKYIADRQIYDYFLRVICEIFIDVLPAGRQKVFNVLYGLFEGFSRSSFRYFKRKKSIKNYILKVIE